MKKIISIVLLILLVTNSMMCFSLETPISKMNDIENHWATKTISKWTNGGLIKGYPDGTFKPDRNITKAEFITIINRVFGYYEKSDINYSDIADNTWYKEATMTAKENMYMDWYEDSILGPDENISRQEVCAILSSICYLEATEDFTAISDFSDKSDIPEWSMGFIDAMINKGYMKGYENKTIKAQGEITRAESLVMIDRVIGTYINEETIYGDFDEKTVVAGNMTISSKNVSIVNTVINGDLILAAGINDGDITLDNVTVKGNTIINGGGENTITISNCNLEDLYIFKIDGKIRIVNENSDLVNLYLASGGQLEGDFGKAEVFILGEGSEVILDGDFDEITVESESQIDIEAGTLIQKIVFTAPAEVTGSGKILLAVIESDGVSLEQEVQNKSVASGVDGSDVSLVKKSSSSSSSTPSDTTAPVISFTPINNATDISTASSITITSNESIRNIDNSEITDTNISNIIILKTEDQTGVNVTFSAIISTDKKEITLTPENLDYDQNYYVGLNPVEDAFDNSTTISGIIFTTEEEPLPPDTEVPVPGDNGNIVASVIYTDSSKLTFTKATDNTTTQNELQYLLYYSTSNNLDNVLAIETNGSPADTYASDIDTKTITGLSPNTSYYFNVIVKDEAGNKAAYSPVNITTLTTGSGSLSDPYKIRYIEDLASIGMVNQRPGWALNKHYILMNNLDFNNPNSYKSTIVDTSYTSGAGWRPIGYEVDPFIGSLDGKGYTIDNLYIRRSTENYVGLFRFLGSESISTSSITNLGFNKLNITGRYSVGGIVGSNYGEISKCFTTGTLTPFNSNGGGITGYNNTSAIVDNCYSSVSINVEQNSIGGIVGFNQGSINKCYSTGEIKGYNYVGGITGRNYGPITNNISFGNKITATNDSTSTDTADRIVGLAYGTLSNNYANISMILIEGGVSISRTSNTESGWGGDLTLAQLKDEDSYNNTPTPNLNWDFDTILSLIHI